MSFWYTSDAGWWDMLITLSLCLPVIVFASMDMRRCAAAILVSYFFQRIGVATGEPLYHGFVSAMADTWILAWLLHNVTGTIAQVIAVGFAARLPFYFLSASHETGFMTMANAVTTILALQLILILSGAAWHGISGRYPGASLRLGFAQVVHRR